MTKKVEADQRVRKEYAPRGTQSQKMFNFRCDQENWEWLQKQPNKGRLVNELIAAARTKP